MYRVKYPGGDVFDLTPEEHEAAVQAWEQRKPVHVTRLNVLLSPYFTWAGAPPEDKTRGRLHDGTRVFKEFGVWKDVECPDVRLDPAYYPEIARDEVMSEEQYERNVTVAHEPN